MIKKKTILLLIDTVDAYDRNLLKGIIKYARSYTSWLLIRQPPIYRNISENKTELNFIGVHPSGVIASEYKFSSPIKHMNIPKIIAPYKKIIKGIPNILTNDIAIGEMGANYFISKGYQHYAFYGYSDSFWSKARQKAFQNTVGGLNLSVYCKNKRSENPRMNIQKMIENLAIWLRDLPKPLAVMLCSDDLSLELMEATRMVNARIPDDVAILGVDNDDLICELCNPPLSSIEHDPFTVGFEVAKKLDQMIKGESHFLGNIIGNPHYIESRQSTDILAINDKNLSKALNFINDKAPISNISVEDVVRVSGLSRRQLERKFLNTILRGIHKEIHRVKVTRIKYLLFSCNLSISEIAEKTGFNSADNFTRYFKQITGISPREYKKKRILRT